MRQSRERTSGFSLLEMMVAIAILAVSLGTLYQAVSGATRNVRTDEKYAYGVELARSLLASNAMVPASGLNAQGETEGEFKWEADLHFGHPSRGHRPTGDDHARPQTYRVCSDAEDLESCAGRRKACEDDL